MVLHKMLLLHKAVLFTHIQLEATLLVKSKFSSGIFSEYNQGCLAALEFQRKPNLHKMSVNYKSKNFSFSKNLRSYLAYSYAQCKILYRECGGVIEAVCLQLLHLFHKNSLQTKKDTQRYVTISHIPLSCVYYIINVFMLPHLSLSLLKL